MLKKLIYLVKIAFSKPYDASTLEGRSLERYRRASLSTLSAIAARIINIATGLATVPLTLGYLGTERWGIWMALSSFVSFLTFSDLGMGVGLQNALSELDGKGDFKKPKVFISSSLFLMVLVFLALVSLSLFVLPLLPFDKIIKVSENVQQSEIILTAQTVLISFGLRLPVALIQRIYIGYQKGYWANLWLLVGRIVGFVGVLVAIYFKLSLPYLVFSVMGIPFVSLGVGSITLFVRSPHLRPSISSVRFFALKRILGIGIVAVGGQVGYIVIQNGPAIVIANRLGAAALTPYAITMKLLGVLSIIISTATLSLWPAYGEAAARGDLVWVKKTFNRSILFTVLMYLPIFIGFIFLGQSVIRFWTQNPEAVPSIALLMACNCMWFAMCWQTTVSMLLNGLNHMIGQATYGVALSFAAVFISYITASPYGISAIVWTIFLLGGVSRGLSMFLECKYVLYKRQKAMSSPEVKLPRKNENRNL